MKNSKGKPKHVTVTQNGEYGTNYNFLSCFKHIMLYVNPSSKILSIFSPSIFNYYNSLN